MDKRVVGCNDKIVFRIGGKKKKEREIVFFEVGMAYFVEV